MMRPAPEFARTEDLIPIRGRLSECGLVYEDLTSAHLAHFVVIHSEDGSELVGTAGLEPCGKAGLLRSVALASAARGKGFGHALVAAIEDYARSLGITKLWLLTTTAAKFFARLDYQPADRASAPAEVQSSAEFTSLCPASATCLVKHL